MPEPKQYIDAVLSLKDSKKFPEGTKITLKFNDKPDCPVYIVTGAGGVDKLFGHLIAGQTTRSGLNADLKGATQTFKLVIELPATANDTEYTLLVQTAAFKADVVATDGTDLARNIDTPYEIKISGYGH